MKVYWFIILIKKIWESLFLICILCNENIDYIYMFDESIFVYNFDEKNMIFFLICINVILCNENIDYIFIMNFMCVGFKGKIKCIFVDYRGSLNLIIVDPLVGQLHISVCRDSTPPNNVTVSLGIVCL
jgi:hypothetical protein